MWLTTGEKVYFSVPAGVGTVYVRADPVEAGQRVGRQRDLAVHAVDSRDSRGVDDGLRLGAVAEVRHAAEALGQHVLGGPPMWPVPHGEPVLVLDVV